MENLTKIYNDKRAMSYLRQKVDEVSSTITNIEKLEGNIYDQLRQYYQNVLSGDKRISYGRIRTLIDREIDKAKKEYRLQRYSTYSDLAVTNDFGESMDFVPEDKNTRTELIVEELLAKSWYNKEIARLATDDFERFVLKAWFDGLKDSDIARELALLNEGKFNSLKVRISRFKVRCQEELNIRAIA